MRGLLETILETSPSDVEDLKTKTFAGSSQTVAEALTEKIAMIGEKLSIRRFAVANGTMSTYIHGGGTTGVIVCFEADDAVKNSPAFPEVAKNIALQIAAGNPPTYVAKEDVPESAVEEELAIQVAAAKNDPKLAIQAGGGSEEDRRRQNGQELLREGMSLGAGLREGRFPVGRQISGSSRQGNGRKPEGQILPAL